MVNLLSAALCNTYSTFINDRYVKVEQRNHYKPNAKRSSIEKRFWETVGTASSATATAFMVKQALPYIGTKVALGGVGTVVSGAFFGLVLFGVDETARTFLNSE